MEFSVHQSIDCVAVQFCKRAKRMEFCDAAAVIESSLNICTFVIKPPQLTPTFQRLIGVLYTGHLHVFRLPTIRACKHCAVAFSLAIKQDFNEALLLGIGLFVQAFALR